VEKGIIPRMVDNVFDHIMKSPEHLEYRLRISIVEIYMEKIRDLLDISK
jgi:kinesin family protein 5